MFISDFLSEDKPKIRKVTKTRADDSVETTYEVLNSKGVTVKTGMSKETAADYLKHHYPDLVAETYRKKFSA
jgi:hypothetical protein